MSKNNLLDTTIQAHVDEARKEKKTICIPQDLPTLLNTYSRPETTTGQHLTVSGQRGLLTGRMTGGGSKILYLKRFVLSKNVKVVLLLPIMPAMAGTRR